MNITISISDARVSNDPRATLVTYSLGSCIGVSVYDPAVRVGGMLHFQLPAADPDTARAKANPLMYADTGMAWLLEKMAAMGAVERRMQIIIAGAAQMFDDKGVFNIGRRNHTAIRKVLWQRGLFINREEIGGTSPRNLYLSIADGAVLIKSSGQQRQLASA